MHASPQSIRAWSEGDPCQEPTGLPLTTLQRVGDAICKVPPGFNTHPDVSMCSLRVINTCSVGGGRLEQAVCMG